MKQPILNKLYDVRFHNWRFFKNKYMNRCNCCCHTCEHNEVCESVCNNYEEMWINGVEFTCDNCVYNNSK